MARQYRQNHAPHEVALRGRSDFRGVFNHLPGLVFIIFIFIVCRATGAARPRRGCRLLLAAASCCCRLLLAAASCLLLCPACCRPMLAVASCLRLPCLLAPSFSPTLTSPCKAASSASSSSSSSSSVASAHLHLRIFASSSLPPRSRLWLDCAARCRGQVSRRCLSVSFYQRVHAHAASGGEGRAREGRAQWVISATTTTTTSRVALAPLL